MFLCVVPGSQEDGRHVVIDQRVFVVSPNSGCLNEVCVAQDSQVMRNEWLRRTFDVIHQFADACRRLGEAMNDVGTYRVGERFKELDDRMDVAIAYSFMSVLVHKDNYISKILDIKFSL
ncbi:Uncharacterised protein [Trueperella bialowiezensis]|uniref:Uncharacterized protein n=1 Tax=Trueperella bialowiezensis TaxID=312285 RepID=A0A448PDZ0_9ACTO|nr:Uncharacterised protein [Trueperella bialowiezensis]